MKAKELRALLNLQPLPPDVDPADYIIGIALNRIRSIAGPVTAAIALPLSGIGAVALKSFRDAETQAAAESVQSGPTVELKPYKSVVITLAAINAIAEEDMTEKERLYGVERELKAVGCTCAWLDAVRYTSPSCPLPMHRVVQPDAPSTDFVFRLGNSETAVYENMCLVMNGAEESIERFHSPAAAQQRFDALPIDEDYPTIMVLVMRVKGGAWETH